LSQGEIARIAAFKGLSEMVFIQKFTRLTTDRRGLALQDQPGGSCVFLVGDECAVQPVKPQQCRDFPNLWNFPGFEKVCRAVPRVLETKEYRTRVHLATGRWPALTAEPRPAP
jgi:uncharacterized protein